MMMLNKPGKDVLKALAELNGWAPWETVKAWLKAESDRLEGNIRLEREEVSFRWMQGALQALGDLLERQDQARELLANVHERESRSKGGPYRNTVV